MANQNETFDKLPNEEGFLLSLLDYGNFSFQKNNQRYYVNAPNLLCFRLPIDIKIIYEHELHAKSILFTPQFINPNLTMKLVQSNSYFDKYTQLHFPPLNIFTSENSRYDGILMLDDGNLNRFKNAFDFIINELIIQKDQNWSCRSRATLLKTLQIADMLYQKITEVFPASDEMTQKIKDYIYINYQSDITLENLCAQFHTNRTTLTKQFKLATGMTVVQFIIRHRIMVAKEALALTNLPLKEISELSGFHFESYFSKVFIKQEGISPLQYRKASVYKRQKIFTKK